CSPRAGSRKCGARPRAMTGAGASAMLPHPPSAIVRRRRGAKGLFAMPIDNPDLVRALYLAGGVLLVVLVLFVFVILRQERSRTELATRIAHLGEGAQAAQGMIAQRMIDQERAIQEQLDRISMRVSLSVDNAANQTKETLTSLRERLAVVDEAQRN